MLTIKGTRKKAVKPQIYAAGEKGVHFDREDDLRRRIAVKAFELYEHRGSTSGRELDDWLEAERIIRAADDGGERNCL